MNILSARILFILGSTITGYYIMRSSFIGAGVGMMVSGLVILVDTIAGFGATADIWVELS